MTNNERDIIAEIDDLRESITDAYEKAQRFSDDPAFGMSQMIDHLGTALRYVNKLDDQHRCFICQKQNIGEETVQHFKSHLHKSCYIERYGQEEYDRAKKAQDEIRAMQEKDINRDL